MEQELKQKIHKSMMELLTACGYPSNLNNDQIIEKLPNLWKKLEGEGLLTTLVARGFNYRHFVEIALQSKTSVEAREQMEAFFRGRR